MENPTCISEARPVKVTLLADPNREFSGQIEAILADRIRLRTDRRLPPGATVRIADDRVTLLGEIYHCEAGGQGSVAYLKLEHIIPNTDGAGWRTKRAPANQYVPAPAERSELILAVANLLRAVRSQVVNPDPASQGKFQSYIQELEDKLKSAPPASEVVEITACAARALAEYSRPAAVATLTPPASMPATPRAPDSVAKQAFELGWRSSLSRIAGTFGRLAHISAVREQSSGLLLGEETGRELREVHYRTFSEWLALSLADQKADLDSHISGLEGYRRQIIEEWARLAPYRKFIPESANDAERELYLANFDALLALLTNEYGLGDAAGVRPALGPRLVAKSPTTDR